MNALLDVEAGGLCNAQRHKRSKACRNTLGWAANSFKLARATLETCQVGLTRTKIL